MKINGVGIQWIKHIVLAREPRMSGLSKIILIITVLMSDQCQTIQKSDIDPTEGCHFQEALE